MQDIYIYRYMYIIIDQMTIYSKVTPKTLYSSLRPVFVPHPSTPEKLLEVEPNSSRGGFRVLGLGFRVLGFEFRVSGFGFGV